MVKALDLSSNGRVVRVGSNPTPGNFFLNISNCCRGPDLIENCQEFHLLFKK